MMGLTITCWGLLLVSSITAFTPEANRFIPAFTSRILRGERKDREAKSTPSVDDGGGEAPVRKLSPLEQALLSDGATGRYVSDGWVEDPAQELVSLKQHFDAFNRIPIPTAIDKFLAIDDHVGGRYRDSGWVDASEPVPLKPEDFLEKGRLAGDAAPPAAPPAASNTWPRTG